jgi:hypothetical protein
LTLLSLLRPHDLVITFTSQGHDRSGFFEYAFRLLGNSHEAADHIVKLRFPGP